MKISSQLYAVVSLLAASTTTVYAFLPPQQLHASISSSSSPSALSATRVVWLTGHQDLRLRDHGGFAEAFNTIDDTVVPVFILDPELHLSCKSSSAIERLHNSLSSLESELENINIPLIIRLGSASTILPSLVKDIDDATSCHVITDDVALDMRTIQRDTCNRLEEMGIDVCRWSNSLRPSAPWAEEETIKRTIMPSFYPEYCKIADSLSIPSPIRYDYLTQNKDNVANSSIDNNVLQSEGLPSIEELINMSIAVTPQAVLDFQKRCLSTDCTFSSSGSTVEPYEQLITNKWSTESGVRTALEEYCQQGKDSFANKHFAISKNNVSSNKSMYEATLNRIVMGNNPSDVLALREAPTRAFSSALNLGSISARDMIDAAKNRHDGDDDVSPSDDPIWGRSSQGALSDVVEWREWFRLLAERSLHLQENDMPSTSGSEKEQGGCSREAGNVNYWRWKGQHLVRYITWPAGKDYIEDADDALPALLLVHGFAASAEQWERLVYSLRQQYGDKCPPIYAVDLLGFGHSEKPGLSYTQYLWEAQLVDFAVEVMKAKPMVMVGNSIGGGLSAGASASLGSEICQGLVLCNTAGILVEPANYVGYNNDNQYKYGAGPLPTAKQIDTSIRSHTEAALKGNPNEGQYSPVPLVGKNALDLFGRGIIQLIYPQIEKRLSLIYNNNMENADEAAIYAIQQSAMHPGSANVIGSGQKLAPNRPLNEVLIDHVDGGLDVLVVMGLDDQVSSPAAAQTRAELFSRLNPGKVVVDEIADAGHCPHDDKPELVAQSIVKWLDDI